MYVIYARIAGGSFVSEKGGGANYLCLPETPEYLLPHRASVTGYTHIVGAEHTDRSLGVNKISVFPVLCAFNLLYTSHFVSLLYHVNECCWTLPVAGIE